MCQNLEIFTNSTTFRHTLTQIAKLVAAIIVSICMSKTKVTPAQIYRRFCATQDCEFSSEVATNLHVNTLIESTSAGLARRDEVHIFHVWNKNIISEL